MVDLANYENDLKQLEKRAELVILQKNERDFYIKAQNLQYEKYNINDLERNQDQINEAYDVIKPTTTPKNAGGGTVGRKMSSNVAKWFKNKQKSGIKNNLRNKADQLKHLTNIEGSFHSKRDPIKSTKSGASHNTNEFMVFNNSNSYANSDENNLT